MEKRKLIGSEIEVSEIGFGGWGIGGTTKGATSYGHVSEKNALSALQRAYERGITFYDTSNIYGAGRSEKRIGKALSHNRDKIVISTKLGLTSYTQKLTFEKSGVFKAVEASLKRLRTTYIDILHLHEVDIKEIERSKELEDILLSLIQKGYTKAISISLKHPDHCLIPSIQQKFPSFQVNFSALDMRLIRNGYLESKASKNIGLVARTPLCFGFLAENFHKDIKFKSNDHRSQWSQKHIHHWIDGANLILSKLGLLDENNSKQRIGLALKFCMSFAGVSSVIPGMITAKQVDENIDAFEASIIEDFQIDAAINAFVEWDKKLKFYSKQKSFKN